MIEVSGKSRSLGQALWQSRTGEAISGSKLLCFCRFARRIVYDEGIDDVQPVSRVERSFVALDPKNYIGKLIEASIGKKEGGMR